MKNVFSKSFFLVCFFLFTGAVSYAQQGKKVSAEERARNLSNKMKTELSLSDSQYTKVHDINLRYADKNGEIMNGGGGKLQKYKALKGTNEDKNKELKAVLTKEQFKKYKEMQKEQKADAKEAFKERQG